MEPTSAAAWSRAATGDLYTLPGSGHIARLKRPSLIALAAGPGVPNPILRLLAVEGAKSESESSDREKMDAYTRQARAFLEVAALAFVEPRLVLDTTPDVAAGEIGPEHLTDQDLLWIYYDLVEGAAARLTPFRVTAQSQPTGRASETVADAPGHTH